MGRFFSKKTKKERAVLGYASLIKALLADAFINLNKSDFENPAGFSDKNKASSALNSYFGMRNQLEQLIKDECLLHRSLSTHDKTILQLRLDAIEHWLGVANQLLNDRCYDGWEIISTQLLLIPDEDSSIKRMVYKIKNLASEQSNYKFLRERIRADEKNSPQAVAMTPFTLCAKDLNLLTQNISNINANISATHHQIKIFINKHERAVTDGVYDFCLKFIKNYHDEQPVQEKLSILAQLFLLHQVLNIGINLFSLIIQKIHLYSAIEAEYFITEYALLLKVITINLTLDFESLSRCVKASSSFLQWVYEMKLPSRIGMGDEQKFKCSKLAHSPEEQSILDGFKENKLVELVPQLKRWFHSIKPLPLNQEEQAVMPYMEFLAQLEIKKNLEAQKSTYIDDIEISRLLIKRQISVDAKSIKHEFNGLLEHAKTNLEALIDKPKVVVHPLMNG